VGSDTSPDDEVVGPGFSREADPWGGPGSANAVGEVIVTAVVTAAVVPFVQTLVQKAAEDTYAGVRDWLRGLFRRSKADDDSPGQRQRELLIVRDIDPKLNLSIYVPTEISDRALRSLEHLDLDAEAQRARRGKVARVRIYWDEQTGDWKSDE
jgi:hypothetical protein